MDLILYTVSCINSGGVRTPSDLLPGYIPSHDVMRPSGFANTGRAYHNIINYNNNKFNISLIVCETYYSISNIFLF